jgi:hypothetical protein
MSVCFSNYILLKRIFAHLTALELPIYRRCEMHIRWIGEHPTVDIVITLFRTWANSQGPSETPPLSSQRTTVLCEGGKKFRDLGSCSQV